MKGHQTKHGKKKKVRRNPVARNLWHNLPRIISDKRQKLREKAEAKDAYTGSTGPALGTGENT